MAEALTLRQKQSVFAQLVARLISRACDEGFEVTLGEAYRPQETAELYARQGRGIAKSLHTQRLAIDLNLFKDGKYLSSSESHRPLGEWWRLQHRACRWGGSFSRPDGNHYEVDPKAF